MFERIRKKPACVEQTGFLSVIANDAEVGDYRLYIACVLRLHACVAIIIRELTPEIDSVLSVHFVGYSALGTEVVLRPRGVIDDVATVVLQRVEQLLTDFGLYAEALDRHIFFQWH